RGREDRPVSAGRVRACAGTRGGRDAGGVPCGGRAGGLAVTIDAPAADDAARLLDELPGFRVMPDEVRRLVADSFELVAYHFGNTIGQEGDDADAFYVLVAGTARVVKQAGSADEIPLNVLRRGDSFGEMGLLDESTRVATVRASGPVQALRLDRSVFRALTRRHPDVRTFFERLARVRGLQNFLRLHSVFAALPTDALARIAEAFEPVEVAAGGIVIHQGDEPGPMYVVEEGRLRAFAEHNGQLADTEYLRKGDFFGEFSVFRATPRAATVEALTSCRL